MDMGAACGVDDVDPWAVGDFSAGEIPGVLGPVEGFYLLDAVL
jgi:hypothetical protein